MLRVLFRLFSFFNLGTYQPSSNYCIQVLPVLNLGSFHLLILFNNKVSHKFIGLSVASDKTEKEE